MKQKYNLKSRATCHLKDKFQRLHDTIAMWPYLAITSIWSKLCRLLMYSDTLFRDPLSKLGFVIITSLLAVSILSLFKIDAEVFHHPKDGIGFRSPVNHDGNFPRNSLYGFRWCYQWYFDFISILSWNNRTQFTGTQSPVATDMHWKSWAWQTGTFVRISGHRKRKADEGEGAWSPQKPNVQQQNDPRFDLFMTV